MSDALDLKTLAKLPFMAWVRRMEVDFVQPAVGDQKITITSFVREFRGPDAHIQCTMVDEAGKSVSRCLMIVACVDKGTNRAMDSGRYHGALLRKMNGLNEMRIAPAGTRIARPPNPRVQRTRSSPSARHSPLTRHPLGGLKTEVGIREGHR